MTTRFDKQTEHLARLSLNINIIISLLLLLSFRIILIIEEDIPLDKIILAVERKGFLIGLQIQDHTHERITRTRNIAVRVHVVVVITVILIINRRFE